MKKNYDYFVTYQNTPKLLYFTWIIGLSYFFVGLNCIISYFLVRSKYGTGGIELLIGCVLFLVLTPVLVTDRRRGNRGLLAAVGSYFVLLFVTVFVSYSYGFPRLLIILIVETAIIIAVIVALMTQKYRRQNNRRI